MCPCSRRAQPPQPGVLPWAAHLSAVIRNTGLELEDGGSGTIGGAGAGGFGLCSSATVSFSNVIQKYGRLSLVFSAAGGYLSSPRMVIQRACTSEFPIFPSYVKTKSSISFFYRGIRAGASWSVVSKKNLKYYCSLIFI